jgi:hypothetical protein
MKTSPITPCPVQFESGTRRRIDLGGTWRHQITASADRPDEAAAWEDFEVPGWKSAVRRDMPYFLWFRRTIEVPANWHGKRVVLNLRGARNTPKVFIDGKFAGSKFDGWTPFELDITDFVLPGSAHVLDLCCGDRSAVEDLTKSTDEIAHTIAPVGGFHDNCGPFQSVYLDAYEPLHIEDSRLAIVTSVKNMTLTVTGAAVNAAGPLPDANGLRIECDVLDGEETVLSFGGTPQFGEVKLSDEADDAPFNPGAWRFEAAFPGAKLWTPETPNLYQLRIRLYRNGTLCDESFTRFGFREVWSEGPDFFLNGVKRRLLASSTWPAYGFIPREEVFRRVRQWKDDGVLAFRFHNQPWQEEYLEACDEIGVMTIDESPVYTDGNAMYAYNEDIFWNNFADVLRGMIRRDRNHASLVMWSVGNEILFMGSVKFCPDLNRRLGEMGTLTKRFDPTRLTMFEADRDPDGKYDMIGLHYPHEMPALYAYPDAAEWLGRRIEAEAAGGMLGKQSGTFFWDRRKPLYIGEYLWCPQTDYSVGSIWFGEEVYLNRQNCNRDAKYLGWIDQTEAFRMANVTGMCPWTAYGFGGTSVTGAAEAEKVFYRRIACFRRDRSDRVFAGARKTVAFDVLNDSPETQELELTIALDGADVDSVRLTLEPGGAKTVSLAFTAKEVKEKALPDFEESTLEFRLIANGAEVQRESFRYKIYPAPVACENKNVFVYRAPGDVDFASLNPAADIVVIEENVLGTPTEPAAFDTKGFTDFLNAGGRALVLAQDTLDPLGLGVNLTDHPSTMAFPLAMDHPLLAGLEPADFKWWADGHYISKREIVREGRNGLEALLVTGGFSALAQTPFADLPFGNGHVVLMQLLAGGKRANEPAAEILLENAISYLDGLPRETPAKVRILASDPEVLRLMKTIGVDEAENAQEAGFIAADGDCAGLDMTPDQLAAWIRDGGVFCWHMPDAQMFERLKHVIGADGIACVKEDCSGIIADRSSKLFFGISQEDVTHCRIYDWDSKLDIQPDAVSMRFVPEAFAQPGPVSGALKLEGGPVPMNTPPVGMPGFVDPAPHSVFTAVREKAGLVCLTLRIDPPAELPDIVDMGVNGGHYVFKFAEKPLCRIAVGDMEQLWFTPDSPGEYRTIIHLPAGTSQIDVRGVGREGVGAGVFAEAFLSEADYPAGVEVPAVPGSLAAWKFGEGRVVLDGANWTCSRDNNGPRGERYLNGLLRNLGAGFRTARYDAGEADDPDNLISQNRIAAGIVDIVSNNTLVVLETKFDATKSGTHVVHIDAVCYPYQRIYSQVRIEIDGTLVAEREIASDVTAGYDLAEVELDAGTHSLRMTYGNDGFGDGGDRALFIRKLKILPK